MAARGIVAGNVGQVRRSVVRPGLLVLCLLLPLLAPGIVAGGLLAFTLSIDDYVITFFVQGPGTTTLPLHIYSMMRVSRNMPMINALSTLLLVGTLAAVTVSFWLTRDKGRTQSGRN